MKLLLTTIILTCLISGCMKTVDLTDYNNQHLHKKSLH